MEIKRILKNFALFYLCFALSILLFFSVRLYIDQNPNKVFTLEKDYQTSNISELFSDIADLLDCEIENIYFPSGFDFDYYGIIHISSSEVSIKNMNYLIKSSFIQSEKYLFVIEENVKTRRFQRSETLSAVDVINVVDSIDFDEYLPFCRVSFFWKFINKIDHMEFNYQYLFENEGFTKVTEDKSGLFIKLEVLWDISEDGFKERIIFYYPK
ncbi:MAG: hypothetical protein LBV58_01250 [Acholeplasmatales bacterium]|jgi:hypothetical protein|nr:hypothetical protein [Acholeplasmatales bacterium]